MRRAAELLHTWQRTRGPAWVDLVVTHWLHTGQIAGRGSVETPIFLDELERLDASDAARAATLPLFLGVVDERKRAILAELLDAARAELEARREQGK